jgi:hypothetical protein
VAGLRDHGRADQAALRSPLLSRGVEDAGGRRRLVGRLRLALCQERFDFDLVEVFAVAGPRKAANKACPSGLPRPVHASHAVPAR